MPRASDEQRSDPQGGTTILSIIGVLLMAIGLALLVWRPSPTTVKVFSVEVNSGGALVFLAGVGFLLVPQLRDDQFPPPSTVPTTSTMTSTSTSSTSASTSTTIVLGSECPAVPVAQQLIKATLVRIPGESCAFGRTGDVGVGVSAVCPSGWVCQWAVVGRQQVVLGAGQMASVFAGTWRYVAPYPTGDPVGNICDFFNKVRRETQGTTTEVVGASCP